MPLGSKDSLARRNSDWLQGRSSSADGFTILIAEDSEADIFFLLRAFAASKVKNPIQVVRNGAEVLAYLKGEGIYTDRNRFPIPKIVFLDLAMPRINGFEVLRWKQQNPQYAKVLFVAMSSFDDMTNINLAYQTGAGTFLAKPLQAEDIRNLVEAYTECWFLVDPKARPATQGTPL
jgi:CheY-like chemotaxis protein